MRQTTEDNCSEKEDNESLEAISSEEEDDSAAVNERKRKRAEPEQIKPLNMSSHGIMTGQVKKIFFFLFYRFY